MSKSAVWSLSAKVSYANGTSAEVAAVKDFGALRYLVDSTLFNDIKKETAFINFLKTIGYIAGAGSRKATVNGYEFRFAAIGVNGQLVYAAGSNKDMSPKVDSNDLVSTLSILNSDPEFVALFTSLAA